MNALDELWYVKGWYSKLSKFPERLTDLLIFGKSTYNCTFLKQEEQ
jgi:hypothetical protein